MYSIPMDWFDWDCMLIPANLPLSGGRLSGGVMVVIFVQIKSNNLRI